MAPWDSVMSLPARQALCTSGVHGEWACPVGSGFQFQFLIGGDFIGGDFIRFDRWGFYKHL